MKKGSFIFIITLFIVFCMCLSACNSTADPMQTQTNTALIPENTTDSNNPTISPTESSMPERPTKENINDSKNLAHFAEKMSMQYAQAMGVKKILYLPADRIARYGGENNEEFLLILYWLNADKVDPQNLKFAFPNATEEDFKIYCYAIDALADITGNRETSSNLWGYTLDKELMEFLIDFDNAYIERYGTSEKTRFDDMIEQFYITKTSNYNVDTVCPMIKKYVNTCVISAFGNHQSGEFYKIAVREKRKINEALENESVNLYHKMINIKPSPTQTAQETVNKTNTPLKTAINSTTAKTTPKKTTTKPTTAKPTAKPTSLTADNINVQEVFFEFSKQLCPVEGYIIYPIAEYTVANTVYHGNEMFFNTAMLNLKYINNDEVLNYFLGGNNLDNLKRYVKFTRAMALDEVTFMNGTKECTYNLDTIAVDKTIGNYLMSVQSAVKQTKKTGDKAQINQIGKNYFITKTGKCYYGMGNAYVDYYVKEVVKAFSNNSEILSAIAKEEGKIDSNIYKIVEEIHKRAN